MDHLKPVPGELTNAQLLLPLFYESRLLTPPPSNEDRNLAVAAEYPHPRQLHLLNDDRLRVDIDKDHEEKTYLHGSVSDNRRILNVFIQHPEKVIGSQVLRRVLDRGAPEAVVAINTRIGRTRRLIEKFYTGNRTLFKLAGDVQIMDDRSGIFLPTDEPVDLIPQPVPEPPEQSVTEMYKQSRIKFTSESEALVKMPTRYGVLRNIAEVNDFTIGMVKKYTEQFPQRPPLTPNQLTILDDQRALLNGQEVPVGPLQLRVMHRLMIHYFNGSLDVMELENKGVHRGFHGVQQFLSSLELQKVVRVERNGAGIITKANLLPMLFEDRRQ